MKQFWGKYRGTVIDNQDPVQLGRLQVVVPKVLGAVTSAWALPCVPYAGPDRGFCFVPPVGASVWVEFEGGDAARPIWAGCFWQEGERPAAAQAPTIGMLKTESAKLVLDDTPGRGGFALGAEPPAVDAAVVLDSAGGP